MELVGLLLQAFGAAFLVLWEFFLLIITHTWPFLLGFLALCIILALCGFGGDGEYESRSSSKEGTYETTGCVDGLYRTTTKWDGSTAEHYGIDGLKGISFKSGKEVYHYSDGGFGGYSRKSSDGKIIHHFDKDNMPAGYTKVDEKGNCHTYDKWGLPTTDTKKSE